jgi:predicted Zn-dependent protease
MANRQLWKVLIIFMVLVLPVGSSPTPARAAEFTLAKEKAMGQKFLRAALRHFPMIEDPEVVGYVNKVGQRIVEHLEVHNFEYHFYVIQSGALNAFAAPAGHVFINSGLIEIMDDEGELAGILAHEIAHVQSRHLAERIARQQKLNIASLGGMLAGIFLGGEAGTALSRGSMAGGVSAELNYSRLDEEEADRRGLIYLEAAGYHGADFVKIMRKMGQDSWKAGGGRPTYLSTHPGVPERVTYLATIVEARPQSSKLSDGLAGDAYDFMLMETKLLGGYHNAPEAEAIFHEWMANPQTKAMAYYGMGLVRRRLGKMEEATESFKKAIALRPDLAPILVELGETYFLMGKIDRAVSVLGSALSLEPNQPVALYMLGRCRLEMGDAAEAVKNLTAAERFNNRLPSIHYYLGMAYGQLNRLGQAHYQFGLHHERKGSLKTAAFHFQEALKYADDQTLRDAINKELNQIRGEIRVAERNENSRNR